MPNLKEHFKKIGELKQNAKQEEQNKTHLQAAAKATEWGN